MFKYRTILTAGGNPTGIMEVPDQNRRCEYVEIAKQCMAQDSRLEQFGFLEGATSFYMSGGEFSGNGARAAAWLIYQKTGNTSGSFEMLGLEYPVNYVVSAGNQVQCEFLELQVQSRRIDLDPELVGTLVDLGGIVHFVFNPSFKFTNDQQFYKSKQAQVMEQLQLQDKPAVGVIWQEPISGGVKIDPIVWVRDINSFFYETACGSGTMAVQIASGKTTLAVTQPSGKVIIASKTKAGYSLASEVSEA